ncbi:protein PET100 homolog, mitochondrial [Orussus abietinus]|uniref:protein PET100 homolog, mitochondrial n=1 Tax=Orussus abietinus TaxID=222816 RepID=UPI000625494F|nr:protein PET100 homolog, mitochondrial [Orussus abietinus]
MGNWQLEVFKMMLYTAFPVVLFHYFNQPENYEKWVVQVRKERFPKDSHEKRRIMAEFLENMTQETSLQEIDELDAKLKRFDL